MVLHIIVQLKRLKNISELNNPDLTINGHGVILASLIVRRDTMMNQFVVRYIPGGMGLDHSGWWLCEKITWRDGSCVEFPQKYLRRSDYK